MEIEEDKILAAFDSAKTPEAKKILIDLFGESIKIKPSLEDYKSIRTYEDACEALEEETILNKTTRMMYDNLGNIIGEFPKHIIALMKLETISRALWGKNFEPKPDAEETAIYYYPWFVLYTKKEIENMDDDDKGALLSAFTVNGAYAGFGCLYASNRSSYAPAYIGFRLCQETEEKAKYFGKQFVELWGEYLSFNFIVGGRI
jgi:hypothetical protein